MILTTSAFSYGERGAMIMATVLELMFEQSDTNAVINAVPFRTFMWRVLMPHTTLLLVQEDFSVSVAKATSIIEASGTYGQLVYPDPDTLDDDEVTDHRAQLHQRRRSKLEAAEGAREGQTFDT